MLNSSLYMVAILQQKLQIIFLILSTVRMPLMRQWPANGHLCGWRYLPAGLALCCMCGLWLLRWFLQIVTLTKGAVLLSREDGVRFTMFFETNSIQDYSVVVNMCACAICVAYTLLYSAWSPWIMSFCHFTKWLFLAELSENCYDGSFHRIIPRSSALGALEDQGLLEVCLSSHSQLY